jgi:hypothetical protein
MKRTLISIGIGLAILSLTGCSLALLRAPKTISTPILLSSPTPLSATSTPADTTPGVPTPILGMPTVTPGSAAPTSIPAVIPTAITAGILPGLPSGPYGVILVAPGNMLNIHSAPGTGSPVNGSFPATNTTVMRTGPSSNIGGDQWVQVQIPGGGTGLVNAAFLTEYVAPAVFCADGRVNTLLTIFGNALTTSNGQALYSLVSPAHGMAVRLWRNGNAVVFDQAHAQWIFVSTYEHNWGAAPGSGMDTIGAIHSVVLPKWLDVLNAPTPGYTLSCNAPQTGGASYNTSWPAIYTNVNFYSLYKPGPTDNENSWRTLLIGVEYFHAQPYLFSVTQMDWEP